MDTVEKEKLLRPMVSSCLYEKSTVDGETAWNPTFTTFVGLDLDNNAPSFTWMRNKLDYLGYQYLLYTTAKHGLDGYGNRLRIILPFSRGFDNPIEHNQISIYLADQLGIGACVDRSKLGSTALLAVPGLCVAQDDYQYHHGLGACRFDPYSVEIKPTVVSKVIPVEPYNTDLGQLAAMLAKIDPDSGRREWLSTIFSSMEEFGEGSDCVGVLESWSMESDKWNASAFASVVNSFEKGKSMRLSAVLAWGQSELSSTNKEAANIVYHKALDVIEQHGNTLTDKHKSELYNCSYNLFLLLEDKQPTKKIGITLGTGVGKTSIIKAYLYYLVNSGRAAKLPVVVTSETLSNTDEIIQYLYDELTTEEFSQYIGYSHSRSNDNVLKFYRSISAGEVSGYPIVVKAHAGVFNDIKRNNNVLQYTDAKGLTLNRLILWDETLLGMDVKSFKVSTLIGDISDWQSTYENKLAKGVSTNTVLSTFSTFASDLRAKLDANSTDVVINGDILKDCSVPTTHEAWVQKANNVIERGGAASDLSKFVEVLTSRDVNIKVRKLANDTTHLLILEEKIPSSIERLAIFDASQSISRIAENDSSLTVLPSYYKPSYCNVKMDFIASKCSRSYISSTPKNENLPPNFEYMLQEFVRWYSPDKGKCLLVTPVKARHIDKSQKVFDFPALAQAYLMKQYSTFKEKIVIAGKTSASHASDHIVITTFGLHKGTNSFSDFTNVALLGKTYRNRDELNAQILGMQSSDEALGNKALTKAQNEINAQDYYQAINRIACRRSCNGIANASNILLIYPDTGILPILDIVMPNLIVRQIEPRYVVAKGSSAPEVNADKILDRIQNYSNHLSVLVSVIKAELGFSKKVWDAAVIELNLASIGWIGSGRGKYAKYVNMYATSE